MIPLKAVRPCLRPLAPAILLALLAVPGLRASTQPFIAENPGPGSVTIDGKWQFHLGDSLNWSNPSFDDSNWEELDSDETWGDQTHPGYTGFAWYRKHIQIGGRGGKLAVLIPPVEDAYEVYWNGHKLGGSGKFPPHAWWFRYKHGTVFGLGGAPLDGVLALRVWQAPLSSDAGIWGGGLQAAPLIGSPAVLAMRPNLTEMKSEYVMLPRFIFAGALFITGVIALLLYLRERRNLIYLWLALLFISNFVWCMGGLSIVLYGMSNFANISDDGIVLAVQNISLWMLLLTLFGLHQRPAWRRWSVALIAINLSALAVDLTLKALWENAGPGMQAGAMAAEAITALTPIYLLVIVVAGVRRRASRALLPLALTAAIYGGYNMVLNASWVGIRYTHFRLPWNHLNPAIPLGPYVFGIPAILNTMLFLVLLFTVARERARERLRQMHIEGEIASAHEVQDVLIPADLPAIPGFAISSVYKPAAEVGGDFYQVIPLGELEQEPRALIVLGDVSGKGLKAAMSVSLIVGTVRTLAEFTDDPAEILTRLNQRLLGRTRGGFATCVALLIEPNGRTVIANAGHLAPFCAGREMDLPGSLPLGLAAEERYESITTHLQAGETLTLMTDGVLEARGPRGELYGYERLSTLMQAQPTVQQIVDAACSFGQDDDITVLSVALMADTERGDARLEMSAQIARQ
jgi:hypothetical protein